MRCALKNEHDFANAKSSSFGCARVLKTSTILQLWSAPIFGMRLCFKTSTFALRGRELRGVGWRELGISTEGLAFDYGDFVPLPNVV
jgi:hypothetical protein